MRRINSFIALWLAFATVTLGACVTTPSNQAMTAPVRADKKPVKSDWQLNVELALTPEDPHTLRTGRYTASQGGCQLRWGIVERREDKRVHMRIYGSPASQAGSCRTLDVGVITAGHREVLKAIQRDWSLNQSSLFTQQIDFGRRDYAANAIAQASVSSAAYRDFKLNYPNHKSGSENQILMKIILKSAADRQLQSIFQGETYQLTLSGVEKVFTAKGKPPINVPIAQSVIDSKQRYMLGAGSYSYKISRTGS